MADIEVRPIVDAELAEYLRCVATAFFLEHREDEETLAFWRDRAGGDFTRRHAGFVGGNLVGTAGAFAAELTVPGGETTSIGAITVVTVLPTHRRRGVLQSMMEVQLADAIDRGEVAAMLIAAEWPIYGRYGYGMAIEAASTVVDTTSARFRPFEDPGTVTLVSVPELRNVAPSVFDAHRRSVAGPITRSEMTWDVELGLRLRPGGDPPKRRTAVVHRDGGGVVDGYAIYHPKDDWIDNRPAISLDVSELVTTTDAAYCALWRFLANIDWVKEVRAGVRAVDEPLRMLVDDGRSVVQRDRSDHMWLRILDIKAALEARRYEAPIDLVVEVDDPLLGHGGRWRLQGDADGASATSTTRSPDIAVTVDALSGAYLGGTPLWWFAQAGKVDERTAGALARLDTALRTRRAPWCTTSF
ncbi:MAG: GNAT family N-acetyltransferase [Acidimicrobiales bacterium]